MTPVLVAGISRIYELLPEFGHRHTPVVRFGTGGIAYILLAGQK